jgi:hypothetical protein
MKHPNRRPANELPVTRERLTAALAGLGPVDLQPLAARAQCLAAQRRLAQRVRPVTSLDRLEPALLIALSAAHLIWALVQALSVGLHVS